MIEKLIGKIQNFLKSTKTTSPTATLGARSLPPIGDNFMYINTNANISGQETFLFASQELLLFK